MKKIRLLLPLEQIKDLYLRGRGIRFISKEFLCSYATIRSRLVDMNIKLRDKDEQKEIHLKSCKDLERRNKISKAHKGKFVSEKTGAKISYSKLKFKITKDFLINEYINKCQTQQEIADSLNISPITIRKYLYLYKIKTKKSKDYISKLKGKSNPLTYIRNIKDNPAKKMEVRNKMSMSRKKLFEENPAILKRLKENAKKQKIPFKDTSIEVKIQDLLTKLHVEYFTHKYIRIKHGYRCDIFIPVQEGIPQKIIVECDGCYWHGCPICKLKSARINKHDKIRTKELINRGFKVIRLWEHEIKEINSKLLENKIYGI